MAASSLANWLCLTSATVWSAAKFAEKRTKRTAVDTNGRKVWTNFKLLQLIHTLYNCTRTMSIEHPTMHYFRNSRCPSSMTAYIMILTEYSWIIALWEFIIWGLIYLTTYELCWFWSLHQQRDNVALAAVHIYSSLQVEVKSRLLSVSSWVLLDALSGYPSLPECCHRWLIHQTHEWFRSSAVWDL